MLATGIVMAFGSCASSTAYRPAMADKFFQVNESTTAKHSLILAIPPVSPSVQETRHRYRLLAAYLQKKTGKKIQIRTLPSYLEYWQLVRSPDSYDLALDAAHFTDYRISRFNFRILAAQQGMASYSLLTQAGNKVSALNKLAGRSIAVRGTPSMDSARLEAMFHDPSRQPRIIAINDYHQALALVERGDVDAAFLPTRMAFDLSKLNNRYRIIAITEPVAAKAITASPKLDPVTQKLVQKALLLATQDPMGNAALNTAGLGMFIPGQKHAYSGYGTYLSGSWGYNHAYPADGG